MGGLLPPVSTSISSSCFGFFFFSWRFSAFLMGIGFLAGAEAGRIGRGRTGIGAVPPPGGGGGPCEAKGAYRSGGMRAGP